MKARGLSCSVILLFLLVQIQSTRASITDTLSGADTTNLITFTHFPRFDPFRSNDPIRISLEPALTRMYILKQCKKVPGQSKIRTNYP